MARLRLLAEILLGVAVLLTKPDGTPLWVAESNVVAVGSASSKVGADPRAKSVIFTTSVPLYVREPPDVVVKKFGWTP
jgi:hypothetical protein